MLETINQLRNLITQARTITRQAGNDNLYRKANDCRNLLGQIDGVFCGRIKHLHHSQISKYAVLIGIYIDQLRQLTDDITVELERIRDEL